MSGWITSAEAVVRVGLRRADIYRLLDGQPDFWLRLDRERHTVLVPEAAIDRLVAQRRSARPPPDGGDVDGVNRRA